MVDSHGYCSKSPNWGLFPFQMAVSWLINGGDPNYLLTGIILQVRWIPEEENISFLRTMISSSMLGFKDFSAYGKLHKVKNPQSNEV